MLPFSIEKKMASCKLYQFVVYFPYNYATVTFHAHWLQGYYSGRLSHKWGSRGESEEIRYDATGV